MFWLLFLLLPLPPAVSLASDPAPGITRSREEARNLECERLDEAQGHELHPGVVSEPSPRGSFLTISVLACKSRVFGLGERPERDEAILSRLSAASTEIAAAADGKDLAAATWLVDAYYPDQTVSAKVVFATKVALAGRGRRVSDRVPLLAAADLLVLATMAPAKAYPIACQRAYAEGSLGASDVLLAVVLLDPQETQLHAGVCTGGAWRWVQ